MRIIRFLFILFLFLIWPINISADEKKFKVGLIGDSHGYLLHKHILKLAKQDDILFVSDVRGGTNTGNWVNNKLAEKFLIKHKPDVLLVVLGTNDGLKVNREKYASMAKFLVELAHHHNSKLVWIAPPPMPFNIEFVFEGMIKSDPDGIFDSRCLELKQPDRVHVSQKDNVRWSKLIWQYLKTTDQPCIPIKGK